jgi:hypothetical protein
VINGWTIYNKGIEPDPIGPVVDSGSHDNNVFPEVSYEVPEPGAQVQMEAWDADQKPEDARPDALR